MTFDKNGADREPPELGGFFIADFRLPIANLWLIGIEKSAIGNWQLRWIR